MSDPKVLFEKEYYGESLFDLERDVSEAIYDSDVPIDEGSPIGTFKVTITWELDENENN